VRDFLDDFKQNWNNSYWWADRQWLMAVCTGVIVGGISLTVKYGELKMEQKMNVGSASE
jgi:hypothetical protein